MDTRSIEPLRFASEVRYYGSAVHDGIDPLAFAGLVLAGAKAKEVSP